MWDEPDLHYSVLLGDLTCCGEPNEGGRCSVRRVSLGVAPNNCNQHMCWQQRYISPDVECSSKNLIFTGWQVLPTWLVCWKIMCSSNKCHVKCVRLKVATHLKELMQHFSYFSLVVRSQWREYTDAHYQLFSPTESRSNKNVLKWGLRIFLSNTDIVSVGQDFSILFMLRASALLLYSGKGRNLRGRYLKTWIY